MPLWTLSYEVWFYILGGAVALLISRRRPSLMPIALIAFAGIVFSQMHPLYVGLWIGGALAYMLKPKSPSWRLLLVGAAIVCGGVALCQMSLPNLANPNGLMFRWIGGATLILAGSMLGLPQLYALPSSDGRLAKLGTFLASFSYSLYLTHAPVLGLQPFKESPTVTALALARYVFVVLLCMAVAFVFSRCFETTGPALKRRIFRWITGSREPVLFNI